MQLNDKIKALDGPLLIIGASGFVGANILRRCLENREDVVGTVFSGDSWRLAGISSVNTAFLNLQDPLSIQVLLHQVKPKTIFDCSSFGSYSFEQDYERIHATNYLSFIRLMEKSAHMDISACIHAGTSSEYGLNAAGPSEDAAFVPNSHYAVSKAATSQAITFYGKIRNVPVVNLRLYSVYGPFEDSSRLIPVLCEQSIRGKLPTFARPEVSRDFVHVDDVIEAFADAALHIRPEIFGESFNIGTGVQTSLRSLAALAARVFDIREEPRFSPGKGRAWDVDDWFANPEKAQRMLDWKAKISLEDGLISTRKWWEERLASMEFSSLTKKQHARQTKKSISAIIACYKDAQAIPIMYRRLVAVFQKIGVDYEIIFVNDGSPDDSVGVIQELSAQDPHVLGITHSRNFGSQAAFKSGLELSTKEACVLLDGDLQDPPELIENFVEEWRSGADVVYGRRVKREMPRWLESCYHAFYCLFAALSEVPIPKDAGDFSLMDRTVVHWLLQCRERDAFLRGLRAYVGFKQVGVDYVRPERMFGTSTNNWIKNIGWAKKGIFSFSRMPLHLLTAVGGITCVGTLALALVSIAIRILSPDSTPKGLTFISLLTMFFGSFTILSIGILGEYVGKIFEETKARPAFVRQSLIVRGEIRPAQSQE